MAQAYEIENKIAVYPRIVMMLSDFECSILSCSKISQSTLWEMFVPDNDCFLTLDCLRYTKQQELELYRSKLEQIKNSDLKVQQKVNWMNNCSK